MGEGKALYQGRKEISSGRSRLEEEKKTAPQGDTILGKRESLDSSRGWKTGTRPLKAWGDARTTPNSYDHKT